MSIKIGDTWKFDKLVAENFIGHAKQHIPNYDAVIDKCIFLAQAHLSTDSKILDFGSATGYTIEKFHQSGFQNLHGIENSPEMLNQCNQTLASYSCNNNLSEQHTDFDLIMSNWTLQFAENKNEILENMYRALKQDGFLIVSEKVSSQPFQIDMYHKWKHSQGVGYQEIEKKAQSLVGVLKLKDHQWWLDTFKELGFRQVSVFDAHWAFCSYLCIK